LHFIFRRTWVEDEGGIEGIGGGGGDQGVLAIERGD